MTPKITIACPGGCEGTGKIKVLRRRCPLCHGVGSISLTKYLKLRGAHTELQNVLDFEKHLAEELKIKNAVPVQN